MLVKEYIARFLEGRELGECFGVSGANIEELFHEIHKGNQLKIILAKTEYGASMMALGQFLANKNTPVVLTTSGPGILNTIPVLAEAYSSEIPLVLISGLIPQELEGRGGFQDSSGKGRSLSIGPMIREVTGFSYIVSSPDEIAQALYEAFVSAEKMKRPSAVFIPKNIFSEKMKKVSVNQENTEKNKIDLAQIENLAEMWNSFTTPPIAILGERLIYLKSIDGLQMLLNKLGALVALTPNAKSFYNNRSTRYLGISGVMGHDEVIHQISENENVIFIGTELDALSRFGLEKYLYDKNIFVLNDRLTNIPNIVDNLEKYYEVNGNLDSLFKDLSGKLSRESNEDLNSFVTEDLLKDFSFKKILSCFSNTIEQDANVFSDAGNTGAFVVHDLILSDKNLFHVFLGMGGMGNSIGACIGSAMANKKRSYAFMGDGAFLMYGLEIHTAVELNLPVVFVVFNNNSHAMCSTRETVYMGNETGINNFKISYLGRGFDQVFPGLQSFDISTEKELMKCLEVLPHIERPVLISLNISRDEQPPFRSFYKN